MPPLSRRLRARWHAAGAAGALLLALPVTATAQAAGAPVRCNGQRITELEVVTHAPYDEGEGKWWAAPLRLVNSMHVTTRPSVVRRFLLLGVGQPCVERRRSESERLLRQQPFISSASVRAFDDGSGGVVLRVETRDELTPVLRGRVSSESPYVTGLRIGEGNLLGTGTYAAAEWGENELRNTYGGYVMDYQAFGRPWIMDLHAVRRDRGRSSWGAIFEHPFQTDDQRIAWRTSARETHDVFDFFRGSDNPVLLGMSERFYEVGGILRLGEPGRLSLFGVSFTRETNAAHMPPVPEDTVSYGALLQRFERRSNGRVNALWGLRNIYYERVTSFDALTAAQDVPLGFQLGTLVGRGLSIFGTSDDDLLVAADAYAAVGNQRTFLAARMRWEGRQNYDANRWDGIVAHGRLLGYLRATPHHTLQGTLDWSAGWRQRVPYQLTLGDRDGGVRGYGRSRDAGAMRSVLRLEDRWYLGRFRDQADMGIALFTDAGRLRAGDAPFGTNTPVRFGVGIGFLAAVPPGSRRTIRMDIAYPVSDDPRAGWELRFGITSITRARWREPRDVRSSRESAVPLNLFGEL